MTRLLCTFLFLLTVPACAHAQPTGRPLRIGAIDDDVVKLEPFRGELRKLGWSDKSLVVESKIGRAQDYAVFAADLVRANVDLIFAPTTPAVQAAKAATQTIPIVFALAADPVRSGFVSNLRAPGGNITGTTPINAELSAKRVELLKQAFPRMRRIGVLVDPGIRYSAASLRELEQAARNLRLEVHVAQWRNGSELDAAFLSMKAAAVDGFVVVPTPAVWPNQHRMAELAIAHRLPGITPAPEFARSGLLIAYGQSLLEQYRRAAIYVDKILRGAKPGTLPVEQPTKLELVINLKAAKSLGLSVPKEFIFRADEVIE